MGIAPGLSVPIVPRGLVSVMPQAWKTSIPKSRSKATTIERGQAEPPTATLRKRLGLRPISAILASSIIHTVGTPALIVTPSLSISSNTEAPSSLAPGITILAPVMGRA